MENVFVQYTVPSTVDEIQNNIFLSGILIGVGVPIIVTSLEEIIKERYSKKHKNNVYFGGVYFE